MQNSAKKSLLEKIKAANDFGAAINVILKQLHYTQREIAEIGGFSPKTISKIINHYDLKIKSVTAYRIVTSLFCNIEISEALLNKAGIHWCNTLVSNVYYEILTYISGHIPDNEIFITDYDKKIYLSEKINDLIDDSFEDKNFIQICKLKTLK